MEQVQIDTIKSIRGASARLIIEVVPQNTAEWDCFEKLMEVHKQLRRIDLTKLGQLALLPQDKSEPGAKQLPLTDSAAVQPGEDSLTEPANREDGREKAIGALKTVGEIIRAHKDNLCPKCGAFEATCDGATIKCLKCGHEAPGVTWEQPEFHNNGEPVRDEPTAQTKAGALVQSLETPVVTANEQFIAINPPEKVTCPGCKGEFPDTDLVLKEGVKECPKCGTALLGTAEKPKRAYHRKSKAVVA